MPACDTDEIIRFASHLNVFKYSTFLDWVPTDEANLSLKKI